MDDGFQLRIEGGGLVVQTPATPLNSEGRCAEAVSAWLLAARRLMEETALDAIGGDDLAELGARLFLRLAEASRGPGEYHAPDDEADPDEWAAQRAALGAAERAALAYLDARAP